MNNEEAASQIFREFSVHWGNLSPLTFEGQAFDPSDPSLVHDKAAGWARIAFEPTDGTIQALGTRLLRQTATVRVHCFAQSGTGTLRALAMADHALLYLQGATNGIRFFEQGLIRLGDRQGWYEVIAQCRARYDDVR